MSFVNDPRMSMYSMASAAAPRPSNPSSQVSTTTLLNALHTSFSQGRPYNLEASTSLVVNTWSNARTMFNGRLGGIVDPDLGRKAWEHARRRAEDGCVVLGSLHESTPSLFSPFISGLPLVIPETFYNALEALKAFTHCVTPQNPSYPRYSALAAVFTVNLQGNLVGAEIKLSTSGLDTRQGLLEVPAEAGFRAFDVFYYLNCPSSSKSEREALDVRHPSEYSLLNRPGTYAPPSYLPDADDAAAAEDFRSNLIAIGIDGGKLRNVLGSLAGLLKMGNTLGYMVDEDALESLCYDCGVLLDISPAILRQRLSATDREIALAGIYEAIVDFVIAQANATIRAGIRATKGPFSSAASDDDLPGATTPPSDDESGDIVNITVVEIPSKTLTKAVALRTVFDDSEGINAEMKQDGVPFSPAGASVLESMREAAQNCAADLGIDGPALSQRQSDMEKREVVLEKLALEIQEEGNFIRDILMPEGQGIDLGKRGRFDLPVTVASSRVWFHLALHPTDDSPSTLTQDLMRCWHPGTVSTQLRDLRLPEWANRRNKSLDFTADFDHREFYERYHLLGCKEGEDGIQNWILERGWSNGEVVVGHSRVWIREGTWWEAESQLDLKGQDIEPSNMLGNMIGAGGLESGYSTHSPGMGSGFFPPLAEMTPQGSHTELLPPQQSSTTLTAPGAAGARSTAPAIHAGDFGLGTKGDENKGITYYDEESGGRTVVTESPVTNYRKAWVFIVWCLTFWIPSPVLKYIGRMKRPDVRMAWREKIVLVMIIVFFNAAIIFYIIFFGKLLCPDKNKAWNRKEVASHQGGNDYFVSHHGAVYDLTDFWQVQHSDTAIKTTRDRMEPFGGFDMDPYIVPPLHIACPYLVTDKNVRLQPNTTVEDPTAEHISGSLARDPTSELAKENWYNLQFLPKMREFRKGSLVWDKSVIEDEGRNLGHMWFMMGDEVYDLTDYFHTNALMDERDPYNFLDPALIKIVRNYAGTDLEDKIKSELNTTAYVDNRRCLNNMFYIGKTDFRKTAKCQVNDYILLAFTIIICATILTKFVAALQLGGKRRPPHQDKFIICQVPAYTEGEDQLRKGLDSLTALDYDNKRKLICVICDGMIVGGGNDRPTPKIVLDILGVDPKVDPPALAFRSVGEGGNQLNYGKVYSGLYEFEGNVVPYIVVVKVGRDSEQTKAKPGNRGKRDSQVLLMSFLNRVHHRSPMNPLELEMFNQIHNIIGVDPELYEYLLMVDADTMVKPDALTRLVAACAGDSKIAGICGETSLENEDKSWWTMIQVYEYYISHHLSKAFESLFGSVTCLPGCFCMYRIRTHDKGKPLIISEKVVKDYADIGTDTLHKKNLLSLGEDRYLTTLMTKHFPNMSYKFLPDAFAYTAAPETFSILLSQRRRWINSTIHNLFELVLLRNLCGFCCFSMRFVVFLDLFGTIILPSVCVYLGYLVYTVASKTGQFPLISIVMLAAVYGLQAIIFIIKRQWQHIGWMVIYIVAFPIYSFVLPLYSFWKQDDFSWGNTRVVIGEKGVKTVVTTDGDEFDPRSVPLQTWDEYAAYNNLPGRRGNAFLTSEKAGSGRYEDDGYEMNDMQSVYSSVKPASTIMSNMHRMSHMPPPQSPGPYQGMQARQSTYSNLSRYQDNPQGDGRHMSMGNMSDAFTTSPYGNRQSGFQSSDNLMASTPPVRGRSPLAGYTSSRPGSTANLQSMMGPTDAAIIEVVQACMREADLERVTKKQLVALCEQRLQSQLSGERRIFLSQQIDLELANM